MTLTEKLDYRNSLIELVSLTPSDFNKRVVPDRLAHGRREGKMNTSINAMNSKKEGLIAEIKFIEANIKEQYPSYDGGITVTDNASVTDKPFLK